MLGMTGGTGSQMVTGPDNPLEDGPAELDNPPPEAAEEGT